jgi:ABC-type transport system substrate-binding protein
MKRGKEMKKKQRILAVIISVLLVLSLAACGSSNTPAAASASGSESGGNASAPADASAVNGTIDKIVVGTIQDTGTLTPFGSSNTAVGTEQGAEIYENLFECDGAAGEMHGNLAKDYKQTSPNTYEVTIYDYIKDSAGNPITASDVVFSYNSFKDANKMFSQLKSCEKIDDNTVKFILNGEKPEYGDFEKVMKLVPIVSEKAFNDSDDKMAKKPVATGPYCVEEYVPQSSLTLKKNENYWQKPELTAQMRKANVKTIVYKQIMERNQQAIALQTNEMDYSENISATDLKSFMSGGEYSGKFTVGTNPRASSLCLTFNGKSDAFKDNNKALRQAFAYAIDAQGVVNAVYGGNDFAGTCVTFGTGAVNAYADYDKGWDSNKYYPFNFDKAKELMAQAGHPDGGLTLTLMSLSDNSATSMAQMVQAYLAKLGINCKIQSYERNLYMTNLQSCQNWDIAIAEYGTFDNLLINVWKGAYDARKTKDGTSPNGFKDDTLQNLLLTASSVDGHTPENMTKLGQYIDDQCYGFSMATPFGKYVASNALTNIARSSRNSIMPGGCTYNSGKK